MRSLKLFRWYLVEGYETKLRLGKKFRKCKRGTKKRARNRVRHIWGSQGRAWKGLEGDVGGFGRRCGRVKDLEGVVGGFGRRCGSGRLCKELWEGGCTLTATGVSSTELIMV